MWPDVLAAIRQAGITRYVIFRDGLDIFHCIECEDDGSAMAGISQDPTSMRGDRDDDGRHA